MNIKSFPRRTALRQLLTVAPLAALSAGSPERPNCSGPSTFVMRFDIEGSATDDSRVPDGLSDWQNLPATAETVARQFILSVRPHPPVQSG